MSTGSSRILLDIPCKVCQDHSSGKHYGIFACDGCAGFFKRSIRRNRQYVCKARGTPQEGHCMVDKTHRNQCRACRLGKCAQVGMNKDAVQHERGPRNSTLRRQMAFYFKDNPSITDTPPLTFSNNSVRSMVNSVTSLFAGTPSLSGPPMSGLHIPLLSPACDPGVKFLYGKSSAAGGLTPMMHPLFRPGIFATASDVLLANQNLFKLSPDAVCNNSSNNNNNETLNEQAAKLLFMAISWPKTVPQFVCLPLSEQQSVLKETWSELFILAAAQFNLLNDDLMVKFCSTATEGANKNADEMKNLKEILSKFTQEQIDPLEYSCLRSMILLKSKTEANNQIQTALNRYQQFQYPQEPFRCVKLLLLLPLMKSASSETVERLFFKDTIGDVPMNRLVCDLYCGQQPVHAQASTMSPNSAAVVSKCL